MTYETYLCSWEKLWTFRVLTGSRTIYLGSYYKTKAAAERAGKRMVKKLSARATV